MYADIHRHSLLVDILTVSLSTSHPTLYTYSNKHPLFQLAECQITFLSFCSNDETTYTVPYHPPQVRIEERDKVKNGGEREGEARHHGQPNRGRSGEQILSLSDLVPTHCAERERKEGGSGRLGRGTQMKPLVSNDLQQIPTEKPKD